MAEENYSHLGSFQDATEKVCGDGVWQHLADSVLSVRELSAGSQVGDATDPGFLLKRLHTVFLALTEVTLGQPQQQHRRSGTVRSQRGY